MLGSPILYFKGMRIMMFQLSGFYFKSSLFQGLNVQIPALVLTTLLIDLPGSSKSGSSNEDTANQENTWRPLPSQFSVLSLTAGQCFPEPSDPETRQLSNLLWIVAGSLW